MAKEDSRERKKHWVCSVVGNNGIKNIFKRIESKKFVGFNNGSGWKKEIIDGSNLKNNKKNDWALSMNNSK